MKIRTDEHVSEEIVRAVRVMALKPGCELTHVTEVGDRSSGDIHWITKFAKEGGQVILSADTDFLKRPHQVIAIRNTGLRLIHLPAKWANARCDLQAAHILLWWRRIEAQITAMKERQCYRPPWTLVETGALVQVSINYQDAERKLKREDKRKKTTGKKAGS